MGEGKTQQAKATHTHNIQFDYSVWLLSTVSAVGGETQSREDPLGLVAPPASAHLTPNKKEKSDCAVSIECLCVF